MMRDLGKIILSLLFMHPFMTLSYMLLICILTL